MTHVTTLNPEKYECGTCKCMKCGHETTVSRPIELAESVQLDPNMTCFGCRDVTLHDISWDGIRISEREGGRK